MNLTDRMILLHLDFLNRLRQLRGHDPNVHPYNVTYRSFKSCLIVSVKQENIDSSMSRKTQLMLKTWICIKALKYIFIKIDEEILHL